MSRDLFRNMNLSEEDDNEKKEYTPPEEELVDNELVNRILEHYITETHYKKAYLPQPEHSQESEVSIFESKVQKLESILKEAGDTLIPQLIIDSLVIKIPEEIADIEDFFEAPQFLTALVQALYNLNYNNLTIDIRLWPEDDRYSVGWLLKGELKRPLTLNVYGDFFSCGYKAELCNFTIHDKVENCAYGAEYSNFTFHGKVERCGDAAKHSVFTFYDRVESCGTAHDCNFTFYDKVGECSNMAGYCTYNLMPGAEIEDDDEDQWIRNTLRIMNEDGEWEILSPESLRR